MTQFVFFIDLLALTLCSQSWHWAFCRNLLTALFFSDNNLTGEITASFGGQKRWGKWIFAAIACCGELSTLFVSIFLAFNVLIISNAIKLWKNLFVPCLERIAVALPLRSLLTEGGF